MSLFDVVLLIVIGGFALFGLWFGLIHTLGSLFGTIVGAYIASRYYQPLADWLIKVTGWPENTARVVMFILAFIIIARLVGFAFWIVDKLLSIITRLPFISSINRILGLFLGLLEGVLTIGLLFYFVERFPVSEKLMTLLAASQVAPYASKMANLLVPLLPDALQLLKSTVDYVQNKVL
ncbi:MAG: Colicin V production protein [Candidatus Magasanikbacteria bacterium GW2011_GWA2_56_11]|uniref:Colicin V production protein n=1 Tax=Candidatus Magasanikbacteria bacterium GW2011_GWA2_56_11 TaxID=1619044 RepID=A0A0G2AL68_9BACT|nr:MAG: Colicin V production protein [Candidatus Magasanikbacteria bacterium GW2011_GWA2_56_11]